MNYRINYFFMSLARRVNDRFEPTTIARHEHAWMRAAYSRYERAKGGR
jgi:hypothetical protein